MPDITKGKTFSSGETVTAADLNSFLDDAIINNDSINADKIAAGAVGNSEVSGSAAISFSKLESLATGSIIVGNSGAATEVAMSGDATIDAAGAVTVTGISDNAITPAKLEDGTQGDVLIYGASGAPARLGFGTDGQFLKTQGTGANPVWASVPDNPSVTVASDDTALDDDAIVTVPANTFLVIGTLRFSMSGNQGAKATAQIKDSSGTVLDTVDLGGGNETAGNDGGSGMTVRDSFTIGVPSNCATIRIYKGAGSNSMTGEVTQFVKLS